MKLVRQPPGSNQCGQACIATICDESLENAIMLCRTKGTTNTKQLKAALLARGYHTPARRVRGNRWYPCKIALLFWTYADNKRRHWTVWYNKKYYDPAAGVFRTVPCHLTGARVTSYLPISETP